MKAFIRNIDTWMPENHWHRTSEELPPKGVTVVLRIRIDTGVIFRTDYIDNTGKWAGYGNTDEYKVTHWIECPLSDED